MNATPAEVIAAELKRIGKSNPRYDAMLMAVGPVGHPLRDEVESLLIG